MTTPSTRSPFDTARELEPDPGAVRLTAAQAYRVATVLGLVEDFFTHHSGPGVRSALGRFAAGQGWHGPRAAAGLIDEVFFAAAPLRRAISASHLGPSTTGVNP
jgi:hypothetical protein